MYLERGATIGRCQCPATRRLPNSSRREGWCRKSGLSFTSTSWARCRGH